MNTIATLLQDLAGVGFDVSFEQVVPTPTVVLYPEF